MMNKIDASTRVRQFDVAPGSALGIDVKTGEHVRVVNSYGGQVVDTWAFNASDAAEYLSMEHSRSATYRLLFRPGDQLVSNRFRPIVALAADTSPGIHDTLHAACSAASYQFYGEGDAHPNCEDNLCGVMRERGYDLSVIPCPWNLFEHAPVDSQGGLSDEPSAAKPGDYVELQARMDIVLVCSACPSTVGKISGAEPRGALVEVHP
jgi:uncharacterized protein YcgI (DUF1989 family)